MKFLIDTPDPVTVLGQQVSLMWIVIGAALVIFMQAGFALVETGMTQAKNAAHVVSTNHNPHQTHLLTEHGHRVWRVD